MGGTDMVADRCLDGRLGWLGPWSVLYVALQMELRLVMGASVGGGILKDIPMSTRP